MEKCAASRFQIGIADAILREGKGFDATAGEKEKPVRPRKKRSAGEWPVAGDRLSAKKAPPLEKKEPRQAKKGLPRSPLPSNTIAWEGTSSPATGGATLRAPGRKGTRSIGRTKW